MKKITIFAVNICLLSSCSNNSNNEAALKAAQQRTIDSLKTEAMKRQVIDSVNQANAMQQNNQQVVTTASVRSHHSHYYAGNTGGSSNAVASSDNNSAPAGKQRNGWSAKAKGAVIGAGVGGITGALVDKKKGQGAVIGGVLGAASGLGVGAIIDNKDKKK